MHHIHNTPSFALLNAVIYYTKNSFKIICEVNDSWFFVEHHDIKCTLEMPSLLKFSYVEVYFAFSVIPCVT